MTSTITLILSLSNSTYQENHLVSLIYKFMKIIIKQAFQKILKFHFFRTKRIASFKTAFILRQKTQYLHTYARNKKGKKTEEELIQQMEEGDEWKERCRQDNLILTNLKNSKSQPIPTKISQVSPTSKLKISTKMGYFKNQTVRIVFLAIKKPSFSSQFSLI